MTYLALRHRSTASDNVGSSRAGASRNSPSTPTSRHPTISMIPSATRLISAAPPSIPPTASRICMVGVRARLLALPASSLPPPSSRKSRSAKCIRAILRSMDDTLMWAYLAGFTDGDGCITRELSKGSYHYARIRWNQKESDSAVLDVIAEFLTRQGIKLTSRNFTVSRAGHKYPQRELGVTIAGDTRLVIRKLLP